MAKRGREESEFKSIKLPSLKFLSKSLKRMGEVEIFIDMLIYKIARNKIQ